MEAGGSIVTIGDSTALAQFLGVPLANGLEEITADGQEHPLPHEKFYVPGSVLQVSIDNTNPVAYGMPSVGGRILRKQSGLPHGARRRDEGCAAGRLVPECHAVTKRLGLGTGYLEGTVAAAEAR